VVRPVPVLIIMVSQPVSRTGAGEVQRARSRGLAHADRPGHPHRVLELESVPVTRVPDAPLAPAHPVLVVWLVV